MSFGKRLLEARKNKGLSQEDLAGQLGTKGPAIGRYERDEMKPSIDVAAKIANILDVSLDWLVGHTDMELDSKMMERIQEVTQMKDKDREHVFAMLDAFIKQTKLQNVLQWKTTATAVASLWILFEVSLGSYLEFIR